MFFQSVLHSYLEVVITDIAYFDSHRSSDVCGLHLPSVRSDQLGTSSHDFPQCSPAEKTF
jgi:hypothetical protein